MLDINNMYQLTIVTSGFLFFAVLFFNGFMFLNWFNCLNWLKSLHILVFKNIKENKSDIGIPWDKKLESDCESPDDSTEYTDSDKQSYIGIKKVSYDPNTNFEPKQKMRKTKSQSNMIKSFSPQHEKLMSYSHTYANLSKLVPANTPSKMILDELIKNKNNNIMACCNPFCRKEIKEPEHFAFDGYYCNESCRHFVYQNMQVYWTKLY